MKNKKIYLMLLQSIFFISVSLPLFSGTQETNTEASGSQTGYAKTASSTRWIRKGGKNVFFAFNRGLYWSPILKEQRDSGWKPSDGNKPHGTVLGLSFDVEYPVTDRFCLGWGLGMSMGVIFYKSYGVGALVVDSLGQKAGEYEPGVVSDLEWTSWQISSDYYYYLYKKSLCLKGSIGFCFGSIVPTRSNPLTSSDYEKSEGYWGGFAGAGVRYILPGMPFFSELGFQLHFVSPAGTAYANPYLIKRLVFNLGVIF